MGDVARVGGKNASLGEMISNLAGAGIRVPDGFATTAQAYREFIRFEGLEGRIRALLANLDVDDVAKLQETGGKIREMMIATPLPRTLEADIREAWSQLTEHTKHTEQSNGSVAVRSSATAEDLPEASFAGQQETFLNVSGIDAVLHCVRRVFASLFNDRAIAYRVHQGFDHAEVALSAGIQRMVRSDRGASGAMFTIDTESGFEEVVFITSSWGLGECVVQGAVNPDEFYVYKPALAAQRPAIVRRTLGSKLIKMVYAGQGSDEMVETVDVAPAQQKQFSLNDEDVTELARMAVAIEAHYRRPMDIEWGRDGDSGEIFILQARPETVKSRAGKQVLERYQLSENSKNSKKSAVLVTGRSVGHRIGSGRVRLAPNVDQLQKVRAGDVLVTDMTDPDWEPVMKRASAIITNRGGRTCHAAIIARELGVPAIVGCGDATERLADGTEVTASCAEGDTGVVYAGLLDYRVTTTDLEKMPELPFKIAMNAGNPERAFALSRIPNAGVGLARLEFIINNTIGIHPKALLQKDRLPVDVRRRIEERMAGYADPRGFYIEKLTEGIGSLGAAFFPQAGDRAPVRFQVQRIRQPHRRRAVRARRGKPDAGFSRRVALHFRLLSRVLRDGMRGAQKSAG